MSFFKKKEGFTNTVIVTGIEIIPVNTGKQSMKIHYKQKNKEGILVDKSYVDFFNVPFCRVYLKDDENCQKEIDRWAENIKQHMIESYWKFFSTWFSRENFTKAVELCYDQFQQFLDSPSPNRNEITTFRDNLQLFVTCVVEQFVNSLNQEEFPEQEVFMFGGVDAKGYYKPCKPEQLQVITRYTVDLKEGDKKKYNYNVDKNKPHYIDFNPTVFNAQYPFQFELHSNDVVGYLAKTIINPNGFDNNKEQGWISNLPKGECSKFTFDFLNKVRIWTKREWEASQQTMIEDELMVNSEIPKEESVEESEIANF